MRQLVLAFPAQYADLAVLTGAIPVGYWHLPLAR